MLRTNWTYPLFRFGLLRHENHAHAVFATGNVEIIFSIGDRFDLDGVAEYRVDVFGAKLHGGFLSHITVRRKGAGGLSVSARKNKTASRR
ncbi:MAG: hypothetical protein IID44_12510 [Planctomycetes bacterium]|nr:hypothetical protein [Planctomycetota bacterium]